MQPFASQARMVGVHTLRIDFNMLDTSAVAGTECPEEVPHVVDSTKAKGVLGKQWLAICLMVESAARLQQSHSHPAGDIAL